MLRINDIAPNFDAQTTIGKLNFHSFLEVHGYSVLSP